MQLPARRYPAGVLVAVIIAACSTSGPGDEAPISADGGDPDLAVAVASFDVHVGDDQRLMAGLYTPEREVVAFGEVSFQLGHVAPESDGEVALAPPVQADWLPVPGMEPQGSGDDPRLLTGEPGAGVYQARVDLDEPGRWVLRVSAQIDGELRTGQALFEVLDVPQVPGVGDPAPREPNLTIADAESGEVPPEAVDSRAIGSGEFVDPHLHTTVITEAIDAGRPVVVAVTTPVFCQSQFCGPLTDVIAQMATEYDHAADFVHIEVWHDFDAQQLTDAAAAWIQTERGGNEPWVFLVGGDGTISARWDNVLDVAELEAALRAL